MRIIILIIISLIFSLGCDSTNKQIDKRWNDAKLFRDEGKLGKSITSLLIIVEEYPSHEKAADARFQIGEIYLNDVKDFEIAVKHFKKVIEDYPDSKIAVKSHFMIGYIYANYLEAYSDGINYYKDFLKKYPQDELSPSVEYELKNMKDIITVIDSLNNEADIKRNMENN